MNDIEIRMNKANDLIGFIRQSNPFYVTSSGAPCNFALMGGKVVLSDGSENPHRMWLNWTGTEALYRFTIALHHFVVRGNRVVFDSAMHFVFANGQDVYAKGTELEVFVS